MSASTKILVLKSKQLMIACFAILFVVILMVLLFIKVSLSDSHRENLHKYTPGVYSSSMNLSGTSFDVQVTVDDKNIKSVDLVYLDDTISTMYPLISSSLAELKKQIIDTGTTEGIICQRDSKYTCMLLLNGINKALEKAIIPK